MDTPIETVRLSQDPQEPLQVLFKRALADFAAALKRWFLPHLLAGVGLFLLISYVTSTTMFHTWPTGVKWVGVWILFLVYAVVALMYSLATTSVFALRLACMHWNDFIEHVLELVQMRIAEQVSDLNAGISKSQARSLVRGSVREVFSSLREHNSSLPRLLLFVCAGALAAAVRAVLCAKIVKWSSRSVQLTKLFAGRATLVGAVFLNLHFFATVLLCACYAFGLAVETLNIYFVFLLK